MILEIGRVGVMEEGMYCLNFQDFLDTIEVDGLEKLVTYADTSTRYLPCVPVEKRNYTSDDRYYYLEDVKTPCVLKNAINIANSIDVFSPIFRKMPIIIDESLLELRERISKSTKQLAECVKEEHPFYSVNAYNLSSISDLDCFGVTDGIVDSLGISSAQMESNFKERKWYFLTTFYHICGMKKIF